MKRDRLILRFWHAAILGWLCLAHLAGAQAKDSNVIINEVMYHPPNEREELQFVELSNRGDADVDLSGWTFTKGIKFTFPANTRIARGDYLVVCRHRERFIAHYGTNSVALGNFSGKLSHQSDHIELVDAQHASVDALKYSDQAPWPGGADGHGSSLERISPRGPSDAGENWAASNPPATKTAGGTPGAKNSVFSETVLPAVSDVTFTPPAPTPQQSVRVIATVADKQSAKTVALVWRKVPVSPESVEESIPMKRISGDDKRGVYEASIPPQTATTLIRFRIKAVNAGGAVRFEPQENELRPSYSYFSYAGTNSALVPLSYVFTTGARERSAPHYGRTIRREQVPARGNGAFVYIPANGGLPQVFDHVRVAPRHGGYKVHFWKEQSFKQMTGINLVYEGAPRWLLSEPMSYELYRLAGVPAEQTEHVRVWKDGKMLGYHLLVEQPNQTFIARHGRDDSGNLYKLLWYGEGIVGHHEKKTHVNAGHDDLVKLIKGLNEKSGAEQWRFIQENFNVDEVASYFAVNMCIQNWDGFFNNYFAYHDTGKTGKWEMYPWDEDKTWGDYDGVSPKYDWYELPLTYGMTGDQPPNSGVKSRLLGRFFQAPWGGPGWWRPPGYFSGPLLANPEFRKRFLARLDEICANSFTEQKMFPLIDAMEKRLGPEVRLRAEMHGEDPERAAQNLRNDIQSLRNQVQNRRKFIQAELKKAN